MTQDAKPADLKAKNRRTMLSLAMLGTGMICLAYASVPLYELFCRVTGFGGTPVRSDIANDSIPADAPIITVRFDANTAPDLPWAFKAAQREVKVRVGENALIYYTAENKAGVPTTGHATFNVTPLKSSPYFSKVQCFCFDNQTLAPGEKIEMPVSFYVDPEILKDANVREVRTITLSYTFFKAKDQGDKTLASAHPTTIQPQAGADKTPPQSAKPRL